MVAVCPFVPVGGCVRTPGPGRGARAVLNFLARSCQFRSAANLCVRRFVPFWVGLSLLPRSEAKKPSSLQEKSEMLLVAVSREVLGFVPHAIRYL